MKKLLCMVLAALLLLSVMSPITVFAENGPYPNDFEKFENMDLENIDISELMNIKLSAIMFMDLNFTEENVENAFGLVYPADAGMPLPGVFSGASYDIDTNTLTLKNVVSKTAFLAVMGMGDDFKIKLEGYNELSGIMSVGMEWGGSVTLTGDGELVLGRSEDALLTGLSIQADETASFFHVEDTVKLKFYSNPDFFSDAVSIIGSTITDPAEIIKLGGNVVSDAPVFEKYTVEFYEQAEAYDLEWNYYDWYEFGLKKDGVYYIADTDYNEETYEPTGKYVVYAVSYDELLGCYTLSEYGKVKSLSGFTVVTEFEPMYDENLGYYIGYTDYPDEEDDSYKTIFFPEYKTPFDLCVDENGTKYGFEQYAYEDDDGTTGVDIYVYNLIDHPTYGLVAVEDKTKTTLDGLTPLKIGEKDYADCYISSDLVINNGGSVVEPSKITGIELKNTNEGVKVSWKANSKAEQYKVYRKKPSDKNWSLLYTLGADKTSYIDKTTKSGTNYLYTVRGGNFVGWGDYNKDGVSITHTSTPKATANNTSKGIYLKWTKIAGAEKYRIYRQTEGSSKWKLLDTTKKTTFTDKTAKSGTKYYYRVRAVAGGDMSSYEVVGRYYLSTPKLSSATNASTGVKVKWEKVTGAEGYKVYRKTGSGSYEYIGKTSKTTYTDKTAKSGKTYTYTVKAYYSKTNGTYNETGLKLKYLAAPKTKATTYTSSISVSWSKVSGAKEYIVYRKASGDSKFKKVATTTKTSYKDTNVNNNKTYSYRVKAVNGKTTSAYKTIEQLFLSTPKLSSVENTNSGVKIKWGKVSGATGYKIYRKTGSGDFKLIDTTKKTTFTDDTAKSGKVYTYTVRAYKNDATSYYNKTGLKIRFVDTNALYTPDNAKNGIQLRWEPANKADKYYVYRKLDGESSYKQIDVVSVDDLKKDEYGVYLYVDKTTKNGKTYFYNLKVSYKNTMSNYASTTGRPITCMETVDVTSAKATSDGIKIKWEKNSYATGYKVLRKEKGSDGGFFWYSGTVGKSATTFLDENVESGKTYEYAVQAIHDENNGKGGWSAPGGSKSVKAK